MFTGTVKRKQYSMVHSHAHRWLLLYSEESSRQQLAYNDESKLRLDFYRSREAGEWGRNNKTEWGGPRRKLVKYGLPIKKS